MRLVKKFYADWCGPCKVLGPVLDEVAAEFGVTVVPVDVETSPEARELNIRAVPSLMFYDGDVLTLSRHGAGGVTKDNLRTMFKDAYEG